MTAPTPQAPRHVRAVVVQPHWSARDFTTPDAFRRWMRAQLEMARPHLQEGGVNLVVLTELNGLPLVLRGGGWLSLPAFARTTTRNWGSALEASANVGFRCARDG